MKKNILYRVYTALFIGMCLAPAALMPAIKGSDSKEKRELAEMPKVKTEDGKLNFEFFDQFSTYFSEHFAFRQELVTADGRLKSAVLGTSTNPDVIVGKDGWLYYGPTADDFLGINTLSDRGINNITGNLRMIDEYCTQQGSSFVFTIAPNKNSIYPEHMPFNYVKSGGKNNYERIAEDLSGAGFWCDMKETLLNADASIPLYHKTDTHWNNLGAYAGHVGLMGALGKEPCSPGTKWSTRDDRLGDLAAMIYPSEDAKDTQVYSDYQFTYNYMGRFKALDDLDIRTSCQNGQDGLLMYRDSYGEAILPYMAEVYENAQFSRLVPYRLDQLGGRDLIIEIVERNIGDLQQYAPLMPAPETEAPAANAVYVGSEAELRQESSGAYVHFYGVLPDQCFDSDSAEIYLTADGRSYKAFNAFEARLLDREGEVSDNGFSLYVPTENIPEGCTVTLTVASSTGRAIQVNF